MSDTYRQSKSIGGTDTSRATVDFEKWLFERNHLPNWMKKETKAMSLGTAIHMALLEPDVFIEKIVRVPWHENYTKKAARDDLNEAKRYAESKNGFILKEDEMLCIDWLRTHWADQMLSTPKIGDVEVEFFKTFDGLELKGRLDWLENGCVTDIKTTTDIKKTRFSMRDYRYDAQLAHYCYVSGNHRARIIWCETNPPYRIEVQHIDEEQIRETLGEVMDVWTRMKGVLS